MLVNGIEILVGADPELFVKDGKGELVSAHGMVEGTKDKPFPVENGAIQVDGMALEFNITPAKDCDEFVRNIKSVMATLKSMIPEDHQLVAESVAHFSEEVFESSPEEALILGCDPDFNAYDDGNQFPTPNGDVNFRTASGHIHIGWTKNADVNDPNHIQDCINIVQQLDVALGLIFTKIDDDDTQRRTLYGKAGCFRVKPYGVEYRTLSNHWLRDEKYMRIVYNNVIKAVGDLLKGEFYYYKQGDWLDPKYIPKYINESFSPWYVNEVADKLGLQYV